MCGACQAEEAADEAKSLARSKEVEAAELRQVSRSRSVLRCNAGECH